MTDATNITGLTTMMHLKEQTRGEHAAAERAFDIKGAMESIQSYQVLLMRLYGIHAPLENALAECFIKNKLPMSMNGRWKTGWLWQDLCALDMDECVLQYLPRAPQLPELNNAEDIVGAMYVVEGSMLGGQYIARMLAKKMSITPQNGGRFFHGYGELTGDRWNEFGAIANAAGRYPAERAKIIVAAKRMFHAFENFLCSDRGVYFAMLPHGGQGNRATA